jgi:hypothetical protein
MKLTRSGLLSHEDKKWRELLGLFDELSEPEWLKPGATGDTWSPKDVLAHIACWHDYATERMASTRQSGKLTPRQPNVDEVNEELYEKCKKMSLHDVRVMSGISRQKFRDEVNLTAEPLTPEMSRLIESNAHGHYDEHLPLLAKFMEGR